MNDILLPGGNINWSNPNITEVYQELLQEYIHLLKRKLKGESVAIISNLHKLATERLVQIGVPESTITPNVIHGLMHWRGRFYKDGIYSLRYWKNNGDLDGFEQYLRTWEKPSDIDELVDDDFSIVEEETVSVEDEIPALTLHDKLIQSMYTHELLAYLLAIIGSKDDLNVWLATRAFSDEIIDELKTLGLYDNTINIDDIKLVEFPLRIDEEYLRVFKNIDVIFFEKNTNKVVACFEIENTPVMYSGLLRFNDIMTSPIDIGNPQIVSQLDHKRRFERERSRLTFKQSKLAEKVKFLSYEDVLIRYESARQRKWY